MYITFIEITFVTFPNSESVYSLKRVLQLLPLKSDKFRVFVLPVPFESLIVNKCEIASFSLTFTDECEVLERRGRFGHC